MDAMRLYVSEDGETSDDPMVTGRAKLLGLRINQARAAQEVGDRDYRDAPRWPWPDLDRLTGPLLPGELWIAAGRPGGGKTSLLLSWAGHLEQSNDMRWLYIGQELSAEQLRRKWAAMRCNLPPDLVLANEWDSLPPDAKARINADLEDQVAVGRSNFAPPRRLDVRALKDWTQLAADTGCKLVILDHFHRLGFKAGDLLHQMSEAARTGKELAVKHDLVMVFAAQLNRGGRDVLTAYMPPPLEALKACGTLEEEAEVVLMLFKSLRRGMKHKDMRAVRDGVDDLARWIDPNVMGVVCRKHRNRGSAVDHGCRLVVTPNGLVESWRADGPSYEPSEERD